MTSHDLLRSYLILSLSGTPLVVRNSEALLSSMRKYLGNERADRIIESTFYKHFCAGETTADVWSRMNSFRAAGVGAILDFAEEDDLLAFANPDAKARAEEAQRKANPSAGATPRPASASSVTGSSQLGGESIIESGVHARTYMAHTEADIEKQMTAYQHAIDTAATLPGTGFAAIKLTALTQPALLEHLSASIEQVRKMFERFDEDGNGFIDRREFDANYKLLLGAESSLDEAAQVFSYLDVQNKGEVDYVSWLARLDMRSMPRIASRAQAHVGGREEAGLAEQALNSADVAMLDVMYTRLGKLVARAADKGVKLMVDAEHTLFNPAIDHIAASLMRQHNTSKQDGAVVYGSYQSYLRSTPQRLAADIQRAREGGYVLGCKLVKGAYYHLERKRAAELGLAQAPVWDHKRETDAAFDTCLAAIMDAVKEDQAELMIGTHSREAVEKAIGAMRARALEPEDSQVFFGSLMGMADSVAFTLGGAGYRVFKYVPYGRVDKCVPYLLRRANEAQYHLMGGKTDLKLLRAELLRRARAALLGGSGSGSAAEQRGSTA